MYTKSGDLENYDFTMILSDPISGVYGKDLKVQGKASNLEGESFDYEADLNDFSIDINMIAETDKKILQFNNYSTSTSPPPSSLYASSRNRIDIVKTT